MDITMVINSVKLGYGAPCCNHGYVPMYNYNLNCTPMCNFGSQQQEILANGEINRSVKKNAHASKWSLIILTIEIAIGVNPPFFEKLKQDIIDMISKMPTITLSLFRHLTNWRYSSEKCLPEELLQATNGFNSLQPIPAMVEPLPKCYPAW